jgi:hypothetical protein
MKYILKYTGILPNDDDILISCSIFKLKNIYKDISKYIDGLYILLETVLLNNIKLIVFYDDSIKYDIQFNNIFNKYKNKILFCYYKFNDFIDKDGYHKGIFGTFVRLMPIFLKNIKYKCLFISDIDYDINRCNLIVYIINKFIKSKYNLCFNYIIGREYRYNNLYSIPNTNMLILFNFYTKKKYYKIESIFFNFLNKLKNNDKEIYNIINNKINITNEYLNKYNYTLSNSRQIRNIDNNMFSYGVDELFLNIEIMPYIIKNEHNIGVIYSYDKLKYYITNILDNDIINDNIYKKLYNKIIKKISLNDDISNDIILMNTKEIQENERKHYGKFEQYNKEYLNKLIYILSNNIGNKITNIFIVLKYFIKYIMKLYNKYPNKKENIKLWIINLKLHKYKGIHKFFMNSNSINLIIKNDLLEIYNFNKLLSKKLKKN